MLEEADIGEYERALKERYAQAHARLTRPPKQLEVIRAAQQDQAIREVWPEVLEPTPYVTPRWKTIIFELCEKHGVTIAEIVGSKRTRHIVVARHEAFHRLSTETTMSLSQIAYRMGGRDHTTVIWGIKAHKNRAGIA